jgi:hypothetical protein
MKVAVKKKKRKKGRKRIQVLKMGGSKNAGASHTACMCM